MFNLIVTVISIALVAALAVASIYYGGDVFRKGAAKAKVSQLINGSQQISGVNVLYANDNGGTYATAMTDLTTDAAYLAAQPQLPSGVVLDEAGLTDNKIVATALSTEVCSAVNKQGSHETDPTDESTALAKGFG